MTSEFRKKKLMYLFKTFFDADENGVITKTDFDLSTEGLAKAKGWSKDDEKYKQAARAMQDIWEGMLYKADSNKDGEISAEEWIALWDTFAKNPSEPADWVAYYCKAIFHVQDSTGDGEIDKEEFVSLHESFGLPKEESSKAFDKLANGKPTVTWEEFQKRWEEFFSSEDPDAPGNFIFGNLSF